MKKALLLILLLINYSLYNNASAQANADSLTYNEKADLPLLGKVWGFLKYHHPAVMQGKFNWDEQLINLLPAYQACKGKPERNALLFKWIKGLGELPVYDASADSAFINLKLSPQLSWISNANFSPEIVTILTNLTHNHDIKDQQYIKFMAEDDVVFPIIIKEDSYAAMKYPDYRYRLLAAFRYWNIIAYWYPYKHLTIQDWDKYLKPLTHNALAVRNEMEYAAFILNMVAAIKDTHAVTTGSKGEEFKGKYQMPFIVKIIAGEPVVTFISKDFTKGLDIQTGYIVKAINGVPAKKIIDGKKPYIAASTNAAMLREAGRIFTRTNDTVNNLVFADNSNQSHSVTVKNIKAGTYIPKVLDFDHQRDSSFYMINSSIMYINIGNLKREQVPLIKAKLANVKGIVFDSRQYPKFSSSGDLISNVLLPHVVPLANFSSAVRGYPGFFRLTKPMMIGAETPDYFKGKVAIIINEETQSTGEFLALSMKLAPNATLVGSETAGADGNVMQPFPLPGAYYTRLTAIGVYLPNGAETQQTGVVPDVKVSQTIQGYRSNKDELLDKAIEVVSKP